MEDDQTWSFRGSKSRNKVSVGEPAEGSLLVLPHFRVLVNKLGMRGLAPESDRAIFEIAWSLSDCVFQFYLSHYREVELSYFE